MNKLCSQTDRNTLYLSRWNDEASAEIVCRDQGAFFKENSLGIDFDIVLERRPATNVFSYQVRSKNLAWFYQPALTPGEVKQGCFRPENVVGSYAVYHQSKRHGIYETGKAFHVFRPMAVDRNGVRSWARLRYRAGRLDVIVDPVFLRRAAYPVIVDPTFGYTTEGASSYASSHNYMLICPLQSLSEAGTLTGMSVYGRYLNSGDDIQLAIYDSSSNLVAHTGAIPLVYPNGWASGDLTTNPEAAAGSYFLAYQVETDNSRVSYDSAASAAFYKSNTYGSWPSSISTKTSSNSWVFSIYVTYTASGGGEVTIDSVDAGSQSQAAAEPAPTQTQSISVDSGAQTQASEAPAPTQGQNLAVDPAAQSQVAGTPTITQAQLVAADAGAQGQVAGTPAITQVQAVNVDAGTQAQTAAEPVVHQTQQLAADAGSQAQAAETPAVTQVQVLPAEPGTQSQAADQPGITQVQVIQPEAGSQAQAAGQPVLTQVQELVSVDPGYQSQVADEVILVWTPEGWVPMHICRVTARGLVKRGSTRRFIVDAPERQLIFRERS